MLIPLSWPSFESTNSRATPAAWFLKKKSRDPRKRLSQRSLGVSLLQIHRKAVQPRRAAVAISRRRAGSLLKSAREISSNGRSSTGSSSSKCVRRRSMPCREAIDRSASAAAAGVPVPSRRQRAGDDASGERRAALPFEETQQLPPARRASR